MHNKMLAKNNAVTATFSVTVVFFFATNKMSEEEAATDGRPLDEDDDLLHDQTNDATAPSNLDDNDAQQDDLGFSGGDLENGIGDNLQEMLNTVRRIYTNTIMSGEADRIGFETALNDLETYFLDIETTFNTKVETVRTSLNIARKEKEVKVAEWMERYDKLQLRWNDCMDQLRHLQEDKEEIRQQRDALMMTHKQKGLVQKNMIQGIDNRGIQMQFVTRMMHATLAAIAENIFAERGCIFLYHSSNEELRSITLYNGKDTLQEKKPKDIKMSTKSGIAGAVFTTGEALNIANTYKDKRFNRSIDQESGFLTKSMVSFPIFAMNDATIGVLQLLNKSADDGVFTVEDEGKCSEYAYLIGAILDANKELFHFGLGLPVSSPLSPRSNETTQQLARRGSQVQVKRLGHGQNLQSTTQLSKKPTALVPKDIDDYIKKLEQCWRKAVGESAKWQNEASQFEEQNKNNLAKLYALEKKLAETEHASEEWKEKINKQAKEFKSQKSEWYEQESKMRQESKELHRVIQQQKEKNGHAANPLMNIFLPVPKSRSRDASNIQLPYLRNTVASKDEKLVSPMQDRAKTVAAAPMIPEVYLDVFSRAPAPMCILTKAFRIWRVNIKFCDLLDCPEHDLIGAIFSDISIVDEETLPKLMEYDVIQGLGMHKPNERPNIANASQLPPKPVIVPSSNKDSGNNNPDAALSSDQKHIVYRTQAKNFLRVNVQISQIGQPGQKYLSSSKVVKGPFYVLLFSKVKPVSR